MRIKEKIESISYTILFPVALIIINFLLKIRFVKHPSLALDEPFSVYFSQFNISTIVNELSKGNNPPFYEIILHFWTNLFGISELSVRFPSVIFSCLSAYFIYKFCHKFLNIRIAILASILFTFSNYQMYFAQEARVYPLFMLLTIISMYQFTKLILSEYSKATGIFFISSSILLLYSHFFSWFVIFIQAIVVTFLYLRNKKDLLRFIKYFGIILIFYLPYLGIFLKRFFSSTARTWVEPVSSLQPIHTFFNSLINNTSIASVLVILIFWIMLQRYIVKYFQKNTFKIPLIILSIIFILISLSLRLPIVPSFFVPIDNDFSSTLIIFSFLLFYFVSFTHFQLNRKIPIQIRIVFLWLFLPCFIMFISSFYIPMFINRYLIYCTPAFFILLALAIDKLGDKYFISLSLLITILMIVSTSPIVNNTRDVKRLVNNVKEIRKDTNSVIFICPDYFGYNFTYYYNRDYFTDIKSGIPDIDMLNALSSDNIFLVKNHKDVDSIRKIYNYNQIIYVDAGADFSYNNNNVKNYLDTVQQNQSVVIDSMHIPKIFNLYTYQIEE